MALRTAVLAVWVAFWLYWMVSALGAKRGTWAVRRRAPGLLIIVLAGVVIHLLGSGSAPVHAAPVRALGVLVLLCGLGLAVWARACLGRNWGMPMTSKREPELVTSGPYGFVRHPIYSGILLGVLGTALAIDLYWLVAFAAAACYFLYSAAIEERQLSETFPDAYPAYRRRTKMLIPFVI